MADLMPLRTREGLVAATGPSDAFARYDPPMVLDAGYAVGSATSYARTAHSGRATLSVWGPDIAPMLAALAKAGVLQAMVPGWITVPRNQVDVLTRHCLVRSGGDWDWMWTDRAPDPVPQEGRVVELDDTGDAAQIAALLAENPRSEGYPGTGRAELWLGVRDGDGSLVACGAVHRLVSGTAHLAGVHTAERARGQGLGRAVSAGLTRWVVGREGVCTLGMYADSAPARAVYHSLGYRTDKEWSSRALLGVRPGGVSRA